MVIGNIVIRRFMVCKNTIGSLYQYMYQYRYSDSESSREISNTKVANNEGRLQCTSNTTRTAFPLFQYVIYQRNLSCVQKKVCLEFACYEEMFTFAKYRQLSSLCRHPQIILRNKSSQENLLPMKAQMKKVQSSVLNKKKDTK